MGIVEKKMETIGALGVIWGLYKGCKEREREREREKV